MDVCHVYDSFVDMKYLISFLLLFSIFFAQAQHDFKKELRSLNDSGRTYLNNRPIKSKVYYQKALELAQKHKNDTVIAKAFVNLSYAEKKIGNYHASLGYLYKSLRINERLNYSLRIGINYFDIAGAHRYLKENAKALDYYNKAFKIYEKRKDSLNIAITLEQVGVIYRRMKRYDEAENNYKKALVIFKKLKKKRGINRTKANIARLYIDLGKYKESLAIYFSSLNYIKASKNEKSLEIYYGNIALNYEKLGDYKESIKYLDSAINITLKNGYSGRTSTNLLFRSENYKQLKLYKKALEDFQLHRIYYDSVFNIKNTKKLTKLELNYEFDKKQLFDSLHFANEKRILKNGIEAQKKEKLLYVILFALAVFGFAALFLLYGYRKKLHQERIHKDHIELQLLNEKLALLQHKTEQIVTDNKMRLDFKKNLITKIKELKEHPDRNDKAKYSTLIAELQSQIQTENRLDNVSNTIIKSDLVFENKLREHYANLTKSEREICNLMRMGLSIKEIMNIRNASLDSIKSARYRIRKKLQVPKGEELELFIQQLF